MSSKRSRRRRGHEKDLPEKVDQYIPESRLLTALQGLEKKVDRELARKHQRIKEALGMQKMTRTLKVCVSHDYRNQSHRHSDDKNNPPSWSLKIQGYLGDGQQQRTSTRMRFSFLVKSLTILVTEGEPNSTTTPFTWNGDDSPVVSDAFEVKQVGNKDCDAKILLTPKRCPEQFRISKDLSNLLGEHSLVTRTRLSHLIWNYAIQNGLVDSKLDTIHCDDDLQQIFGCSSMAMEKLTTLINHHLIPPDPYVIDYKITLDGDPSICQKVYEIDFDLPQLHNPHSLRRMPLSQRECPSSSRELEYRDEKLKTLVGKYQLCKRRRKLFLTFADSPAETLSLLANQHPTFLAVRMWPYIFSIRLSYCAYFCVGGPRRRKE
ncbi:hypothetical protein AAMO2058_001534000 [Amorphochlora amoebiformis]